MGSLGKEPKALTGYPSLVPAYILKIDIGMGNPVGDIVTGSSLIHWETPTGTLTTAEGYEHTVEADLVFGADWLYFDPDKKIARPNVKAVAKTKEGVTIPVEYTGIAMLDAAIGEIFEGKPEATTTAFGNSTTFHTFQVGDPKYKFLEKNTFVGNGRFIVKNDPRKVTVESRISQVVPSADMD